MGSPHGTDWPETHFVAGPLLADILFISGFIAISLFTMSLLRAILLYANVELASGIPPTDLVTSFLVGIRFDLVVACLTALPLVPALLLTGGPGWRRIALWWVAGIGCLTIFAGVAEMEFYR